MIKVLMTSIGSLVGQNLLDAIDARADEVYVVGTTTLASIPLHRCARVYLVPPAERPPSAFSLRLLEIVDREQPDLIVPTRDHDVTVLAELAAGQPSLLDRIPCGSPDAALLLEDKWLTYLFARDHGLAFAESAIPEPESGHRGLYQLAERTGFPLVAKPRLGFGSLRVRLLSNLEQLQAALGDEDLLVQQYIGRADILEAFRRDIQRCGQPLFYSLEQSKYSIQTYVRREGGIEPVCCTLHRMERGLSVAVERISDQSMLQVGEDWARALALAGWRGPLNIQCQRNDANAFVAFELNGRFTGATAARYWLGHDEFGYLLQDRLGQTTSPTRSPAGSVPLKYYHTVGIHTTDMETLLQHRVWEREGRPQRKAIRHPSPLHGPRDSART